MKGHFKRGFTLVEILISVVIIGALSTGLAFMVFNSSSQSNRITSSSALQSDSQIVLNKISKSIQSMKQIDKTTTTSLEITRILYSYYDDTSATPSSSDRVSYYILNVSDDSLYLQDYSSASEPDYFNNSDKTFKVANITYSNKDKILYGVTKLTLTDTNSATYKSDNTIKVSLSVKNGAKSNNYDKKITVRNVINSAQAETSVKQISNIVATTATETEVATTTPAEQVIGGVLVGWNYGNQLGALMPAGSFEKYEQMRDKYQIACNFYVNYSSGSYVQNWPQNYNDAGSYTYVDKTTGAVNYSWKISSLSSTATNTTYKPWRISVKLMNNVITASSNSLNYTVSNAIFTKADGTVVPLTGMNGTYTQALTLTSGKGMTTEIYQSLPSLTASGLTLATDYIGGTVSFSLQINTWCDPVTTTTTKEYYYEVTATGNPLATQAIVDTIKAAGYTAVRLPVTWFNHMSADGTIDTAWLGRVAQVVQYCLNDGLYVIINVHHDSGAAGWLQADATNYLNNNAKFKYVWQQIATYFKGYDKKLMFEAYNEMLNSANAWWLASSTDSAFTYANAYNQDFVDTVRATGGNNATRVLFVPTYSDGSDVQMLQGFKLPTDTASNSLIVEVHCYYIAASADTVSSRLSTYFVSKGIPCMIGEFGTNNTSYTEAQRATEAAYYVKSFAKFGIPCFIWDDGNWYNSTTYQAFAMLNRFTNTWYKPTIAPAMIAALQ